MKKVKGGGAASTEQLLNSLHAEKKVWVYDRRPEICVRAGELRDEEDEQVRRGTRSTGGGGGGSTAAMVKKRWADWRNKSVLQLLGRGTCEGQRQGADGHGWLMEYF